MYNCVNGCRECPETGSFPYHRVTKHLPSSFRNLRAEITACENLLWYHRYLYYVLDEAEASDYDYDQLERHLRGLYGRLIVSGRIRFPVIPPGSVLHTVGSSLRRTYPKHIQLYFKKRRTL